MRKVVTTMIVVGTLSLLPSCISPDSFNLQDFNASGEGDKTVTGSIDVEERSDRLIIDDALTRVDDETVTVEGPAGPTTWRVGHGIRIQRAGERASVHDADNQWVLPPGAPSGVTAPTYDATDKMEGDRAVRCRFTGPPPDLSEDGSPEPVDICEVDLGGPTNFQYDELRFWIKSSTAMGHGDLQIVIHSNDKDSDGKRKPGKFHLQVPRLTPDTWTEIFSEIEARNGFGNPSGTRFVTLQCTTSSACDGLDVKMDDFSLVKDLVTQLEAIDGTTFTLRDAASRTVSSEIVYHDDTAAVNRWLKAAEGSDDDVNLFAPAGTYYISDRLPLYSNSHLNCEGALQTTFKNSGRPRTGTGTMLSTKEGEVRTPENIEIENCGFDVNGWNQSDFLTVLQIQTYEVDTPEQRVRNIHIRGNHFFDSDFPGLQGCDRNQDECVTRQRQYIAVRKVDGVWIEDNHLSGGGRIKAGNLGLGVNIYIRNNFIDFVNDNAITITDIKSGETDECIDPCLTEHVEITENVIIDPVGTGIFFGADGQPNDVPGMTLRDVTISRNRIEGFFHTGIKSILPAKTNDVHITNNRIRSRPPTLKKGNAILLKNGPGDVAVDIRVERNTFIASGEFGGGGMLFQGPISDLQVLGNEVRCDYCRSIQRAIRFRLGTFENVELRDNVIVGATTALEIETDLTDGHIEDNEFFDSTNEGIGQITVALEDRETVEAQVARNRIQGGAGHGILCRGDGTFNLDISGNDFVDNDQDDVSGCR